MKRILIVNDCKFESIIMKDYLMDIGYSVEVTSEYDALLRVKEFNPDIVIANLIMKNTTGDKLIKQIKVRIPEVICLLSSCDSIKLEKFIENNVAEVIHTPVTREELLEILNKVLYQQNKNLLDNKRADVILKKLASKETSKKNNSTISKNFVKENFSFCPYCGQKFDADKGHFLYCPYCGHNLAN